MGPEYKKYLGWKRHLTKLQVWMATFSMTNMGKKMWDFIQILGRVVHPLRSDQIREMKTMAWLALAVKLTKCH